jgi:hypothetical protein
MRYPLLPAALSAHLFAFPSRSITNDYERFVCVCTCCMCVCACMRTV